jgi:hypothetical protein
MRRIYDFFRLWIIWKDAKEAWQDSKTINDKEFRSEIRNLDIRLEEFLDSIPDQKWNKVKLNLEAEKTHQVVQETIKKRKHAIDFAEWILSHKISLSENEEGISYWVINNKDTTTLQNTNDLYVMYLRGDLDVEEDLDEEE